MKVQPVRSTRRAATVAGGLMLALAIGLLSERPPAPVGADAAPTAFSAARALELLAPLTSEPHPTGSAAHARVLAWLEAHLRAAGLEVEVQVATAVHPRAPIAARTVNLLARMPGADPTKPVVLVAHHDSVPNSHGAGDDAAGVVALLETARALQAGPALRNDVIFAFTDAEELGLLGAQAFATEHPWGRDPGVVLNFEGRGSGGPVSMFETSEGNGRLVRVLASAVPTAIADSLSYEIYRRMPNDTDLSVFKRAGSPGMNFAFIGGYAHYHAAVDDAQALEAGSVQHHGDYALGLARAFGDLDLTELSAPDRVYFPLPVLGVVHYPSSWALPLAVFTALVFVALLVLGFRRGRLRPIAAVGGLLASVLAVAAAAGATFGAAWLLARVHPQIGAIPGGFPYNGGTAVFFVIVTAIAATLLVYGVALRWLSSLAAWMGPLAIWTVALLAAAWAMPGASYLLQWPLAAALIALEIRLREKDERVVDGAGLALAMPAVMLIGPLAPFTIEALGLPLAIAGTVPVALLLCLLVPQLGIILRGRVVHVGVVLGLVAIAALAVSVLGSGWTARSPQPNSIVYAYDADTGAGVWASVDDEPDVWTTQLLGAEPERATLEGFGIWRARDAWLAPAPALDLPAPRAEVVESLADADGARDVTIRLRSARGAPGLDAFIGEGLVLSELYIDGRLTQVRAPWLLSFDALPPVGVLLRMTLSGDGPLELRLVDRSFGLPQTGWTPRPSAMIPKRFLANELTLVGVRQRLDIVETAGAAGGPEAQQPGP